MNDDADGAALGAVRHYLERARALVEVASDADLAVCPAPDMRPVGEQLAMAIGFAGRALLPLAGRDGPEWPEVFDRDALLRYGEAMAAALEGLDASALTAREVSHTAGFAEVTQEARDYIARFALPNMIFHLTAAYVGLKQTGHALGKADFDAIHVYPAGFSFDAPG